MLIRVYQIAFVVLMIARGAFPLSASISSSNYDGERNWRKTLNVHYLQYAQAGLQNIDEWVKSTVNYLSEDYKNTALQPLIDNDIKTSNIATVQFKLLYNTSENDTLHIVTFNSRVNKVFISGLRRFKDNLDARDREKVIVALNFYKGSSSSGKDINKHLKDQVNTLIRQSLVKDGSHSEALILLQLDQELPAMLNQLAIRHPSYNLTILGTILTISSLKDPCGESCLPMLKQFNHQVSSILWNHIQACGLTSKIKLEDTLEKLILLAGNVPYADSRDNFNDKADTLTQQIDIDFDHPQTRVFSLRFEDLQ